MPKYGGHHISPLNGSIILTNWINTDAFFWY